MRLEYRGSSVLYAGDAVGRRIGDPVDACKDAEAWMVENHNAGVARLESYLLIPPHHGADNASASCFVRAVDPHWVVFSAGHEYEHPRDATAQRYLAHGVATENLLRTDRGDDEGAAEWAGARVVGCRDARGDDDIEIELLPNGLVTINYVVAQSGC